MGASSPYSYSKCALKRFCTDVYEMGCRECERVYEKAGRCSFLHKQVESFNDKNDSVHLKPLLHQQGRS